MEMRTSNQRRNSDYVNIELENRVSKLGQSIQIKQVICLLPVQELKKRVQKLLGLKSVDDFTLLYKTIRLRQGLLCDYGIIKDCKIIVQPRNNLDETRGYMIIYPSLENDESYDNQILKFTTHVNKGIQHQINPELSFQGTSGVYFMKDDTKKSVGVFKPFDEEYNAPNNPRGLDSQNKLGSRTDREGILSGEMAQREVATFLVDQFSGGMHRVPLTIWVEIYHPSFKPDPQLNNLDCGLVSKDKKISKIVSNTQDTKNKLQIQQRTKYGSLQIFKENDGIIEDLGWGSINDEDIHRIGILDIRILNKDRNLENVLYRKNRETKNCELIPIDHGYSFPSDLFIHEDWIMWISYPHAKRPFSEKIVSMVESLDPRKNCQELSKVIPLRPECLLNYRIAETFLKIAVKNGKTLYEIGKLYLIEEPEDEDEEEQQSQLLKIVKRAEFIYRTLKAQQTNKSSSHVNNTNKKKRTLKFNHEKNSSLTNDQTNTHSEPKTLQLLEQENLNVIIEKEEENLEFNDPLETNNKLTSGSQLPKSNIFFQPDKAIDSSQNLYLKPKFPFHKCPSAPDLRQLQLLKQIVDQKRYVNADADLRLPTKLNTKQPENASQVKLEKQSSFQLSVPSTFKIYSREEAKETISWDNDLFFKYLEEELNQFFRGQNNTPIQQIPQNVRRNRYMSTDETFD